MGSLVRNHVENAAGFYYRYTLDAGDTVYVDFGKTRFGDTNARPWTSFFIGATWQVEPTAGSVAVSYSMWPREDRTDSNAAQWSAHPNVASVTPTSSTKGAQEGGPIQALRFVATGGAAVLHVISAVEAEVYD